MSLLPLKASSYVKAYYAALAQFALHDHTTEGNTRICHAHAPASPTIPTAPTTNATSSASSAIITVSLETQQIIARLPSLGFEEGTK